MGGNAFKVIMPAAKFPRMPPAVYDAMKARLLAQLQPLYELVVTPHEALEKPDHGDVDFVVAHPRPGLTHDMVRAALGAVRSIPEDGGPVCNFAVPAHAEFGAAVTDAQQQEVYCQVDVHLCADRAEWERLVFLHSYGDLGMIVNLLARSVGVVFNVYGLKLTSPIATSPQTTFYLSSSLLRILEFLGLSLEEWREGFATQRAAFEWAARSPLFEAVALVQSEVHHTTNKKARDARTMYQAFLEYAREWAGEIGGAPQVRVPQDAALRFFGKDAEHDALVHAARVKRHIAEVFTGKLVEEWTAVRGTPVRWIMENVRERLGGALVEDTSIPAVTVQEGTNHSALARLAPWESAMYSMTEDQVRVMVIQVKEDMEAAGKLEFDWRAAKARKAERKLLQEAAESTVVQA